MTYELCQILNCSDNSKCCNSSHWYYNLLFGGGVKQWETLIHNGPMFPPEYIPHNIPVIIFDKKYNLSPLAEEYATMYSRYLNTEYIQNNLFKKNFWKDFCPVLNASLHDTTSLDKEFISKIKLDDIDFKLIYDHIEKEKEKKKLLSKEEKEIIKQKQEELEKIYKYCIIDCCQQTVGNYKIEPPGIFIGRGTHPKLGRIKMRIYPEDVIINISEDAKIPEPNLKGHSWKSVIHDQSVIWLASWKEVLTNKNKYVFTSFESLFKSKSDESKFDKARDLKKKIDSIRKQYKKELLDENIKVRQLATALYLIDTLALRVGNSKDTKEEADTVGVTSLRVEHINLLEDNVIKLDFLGKDSIRFYKKIAVEPNIYENIKLFLQNKEKKDDIFDKISSSSLNEYLNSYMPGLTSKVWRTFNASMEFQQSINKINNTILNNMDSNEKLNYLIAMFNQANTNVAILCNHQKKSTTGSSYAEKINEQIKKLKVKQATFKKSKNTTKANIISQKIKLLKIKKKVKDQMKNVSLGTSKNNYIDPRIIFAFIKKYNIPPEKLFTKTSLKRFEWANKVPADYQF